MTMMRVAVLALLVACACLVRAAEDAVIVSDIDNNEVLPENDVVRARVDEVPASAPVTTDSPVSSTPPAPTESSPETTQRPDAADKPAEPAEPASTTPASKDAASPTTGAPPRQPSTLGKFLSDIIQIPIAVLRSVGSLLSNTFRGNASGSTSTTPSPAAP